MMRSRLYVMKNRWSIKRANGALSPAAQSGAERCRLFLAPLGSRSGQAFSKSARRAHPHYSVKC